MGRCPKPALCTPPILCGAGREALAPCTPTVGAAREERRCARGRALRAGKERRCARRKGAAREEGKALRAEEGKALRAEERALRAEERMGRCPKPRQGGSGPPAPPQLALRARKGAARGEGEKGATLASYHLHL